MQLRKRIGGKNRGSNFLGQSLKQKNPSHNRGQEELVGFVLVVVLIAVAGVIILGFSLRYDKNSGTVISADLSQFLESLYYTTSTCKIHSPSVYASLGEMAIACANDRQARCRESTTLVCDMLNRSVSSAITGSWPIGSTQQYEGYTLEISLHQNKSRGGVPENILSSGSGPCAQSYITGEHLQPGTGRGTSVVTTFKLCTQSRA